MIQFLTEGVKVISEGVKATSKKIANDFPKNLQEKNNSVKEDKREINKENSPYSDEINDKLASQEELDYYMENDYIEIEIGDKKVLIPKDLDLDQKDEDGLTNLERMQKGKAPLDKNGEPYNLHHIGQNSDGPFSLIPNEDHKKMDSVLHDKTKTSEIDRQEFQREKGKIYKTLSELLSNKEM